MKTNPVAATDKRFSEEGDWIARQHFSAEDLQQSPEEYAARHAHQWACFSLHLYRYRDPDLGAWVRRLGEILSTEGAVDHCRQRFLTPAELTAIRKQEADPF